MSVLMAESREVSFPLIRLTETLIRPPPPHPRPALQNLDPASVLLEFTTLFKLDTHEIFNTLFITASQPICDIRYYLQSGLRNPVSMPCEVSWPHEFHSICNPFKVNWYSWKPYGIDLSIDSGCEHIPSEFASVPFWWFFTARSVDRNLPCSPQ